MTNQPPNANSTIRPAMRRLLPLLVVLGTLFAPQMGATLSNNTPQNLAGSYSISTNMLNLTWAAPANSNANFQYLVWRDGVYVNATATLHFTDMPSTGVPDPGYVYFVSSKAPGNQGAISFPAVAGVPTLSCEVVTVQTSWQSPYLAVRLHEECLGVTYDKSVTWTAPQ